jgi:peptidoglycan/LPS O-acetylase OafA/YrhL
MTQRSLAYRADIDGLRAIAILLVCVFHFHLLPIGQAGFIGVDVFFVISGFLITRIITGGLESEKFSLSTFYYRRVRRLYPALLTVLVVYLVVGYFTFLPDLFDELAWETLFSSIYGINIYLWRSVDYFGVQAHSRPLLHMWSLAVEEQFYLFYPLFLMGLYRLFRGRPGGIILGAAFFMLLSFAVGWYASGWKPQAAFYLLPTRAWELMAGGFLALVLPRITVPTGLALAAGPLAIVILAGALFIHDPETLFPGWFAVLPVLSAMLFILGGARADAPVTRLMASAPMVFLGKVSYPLYLVHWPVKIVLGEMLPEVTLGWSLFGFGLSVVLGWVIYRFVEQPVGRGGFLATAPSFLTLAGGLQAAVIAASVVVFTGNGLPGRFPPHVAEILAHQTAMPEEFRRCDYSGGRIRMDCLLGDITRDPKIMVIGDSHSLALSGALDVWLKRHGASAVLSFELGCLPVVGAGRNMCLQHTSRVFDAAGRAEGIETVLIASSWRRPYDEAGYDFSGQTQFGLDKQMAFAAGLRETVQSLRDADKTVVLVEPMYWAQRNVPETLARREIFGVDWPLDLPKSRYDDRFAHLLAQFAALEGDGVIRVSLIGGLCASGTCPALWEDGPVFTDATHMARRMQEYFADVLDRELAPELAREQAVLD